MKENSKNNVVGKIEEIIKSTTPNKQATEFKSYHDNLKQQGLLIEDIYKSPNNNSSTNRQFLISRNHKNSILHSIEK
jgi:hypothetical protein